MNTFFELLRAFVAGVFVTMIFGFGIYAGWNLHKSFRPRRITWRRKQFVPPDGVERSGVGAVQPGNRTRPGSTRTQAELDAISALEQLGYSKQFSRMAIKFAGNTNPEFRNDFETLMRAALASAPQRTTDPNSLRD